MSTRLPVIKLLCMALFCLACTFSLPAAIIGTNVAALPLTRQRLEGLPVLQRQMWVEYLERSESQLRMDKAVLEKELRQLGRTEASNAPSAKTFSGLPLNRPGIWYGTAEARRLADIIVSFQTPAGGWSKRMDLTDHKRAPGEHFAPDNATKFPSVTDYDAPHDVHWSYVGTFDNNATVTQLRFLGKVIAAAGTNRMEEYVAAYARGLGYIFNAQYPNGGWPQVWPLTGGYHDAVTFNDGAMINVLNLLRDVATETNALPFVTDLQRAQADASMRRGVRCILDAQIYEAGRRTVWCQQHDVLTLKPTSARNYEMPSACAAESAGVLIFLMSQPHPDAEMKAAIRSGVDWLEKSAIHGHAFRNVGAEGRLLVADDKAGPIWARYYELGSSKPIFGERDKTIHDDVAEISKERRKGYSWYSDSAKAALREFDRWSKKLEQGSGASSNKLGGERRSAFPRTK